MREPTLGSVQSEFWWWQGEELVDPNAAPLEQNAQLCAVLQAVEALREQVERIQRTSDARHQEVRTTHEFTPGMLRRQWRPSQVLQRLEKLPTVAKGPSGPPYARTRACAQ